MKRLTKIRIKYFLIIFFCLIFFTTILPTFMKYYINITANINGYAKETRSSTYKAKFHSNGGEGTMDDMIIYYNEAQKLSKNTFSRVNYDFGGWNTQADGSGTNYSDEQELNQTTYLDGDEINLYAQWVQGTALIGNTSYNSLQEAINDVSTNNTLTTIKLLKNVSEVLTVAKNKKIIFDFQNHIVSNNGVNAVITNNGDITIQNGTITSSTSQGTINNNSGAKLTISGGSVIATGTRQAIYNNGGTVEITGDAYLSAVSTERATVQNNSSNSNLYITGGTIISSKFSAVQNAGIMNVGIKDSNMDVNSPYIRGATYGVNSSNDFNFYDGILLGKTNGMNDLRKVKEKETGYAISNSTDTIDGETYKTAFLEPAIAVTLTFDANGGTVSETTRIVTTRRCYWNITCSEQDKLFFCWLVYFRNRWY